MVHTVFFGQLIFGKIIVATRGQLLRLKCTKVYISAGASPQTPMGELTALPRPRSLIKGPTSKRMKGEGKEGKGKEDGGNERGGKEGEEM